MVLPCSRGEENLSLTSTRAGPGVKDYSTFYDYRFDVSP